MLLPALLIQALQALDYGSPDVVSANTLSEQYYFWDPYSSNQEVSKSYSICGPQLETEASIPTFNFSSQEQVPSTNPYQTPSINTNLPPHPFIPTDEPRTFSEYIQLLPISINNPSFSFFVYIAVFFQ